MSDIDDSEILIDNDKTRQTIPLARIEGSTQLHHLILNPNGELKVDLSGVTISLGSVKVEDATTTTKVNVGPDGKGKNAIYVQSQTQPSRVPSGGGKGGPKTITNPIGSPVRIYDTALTPPSLPAVTPIPLIGGVSIQAYSGNSGPIFVAIAPNIADATPGSPSGIELKPGASISWPLCDLTDLIVDGTPADIILGEAW